ncbi:MAG: asparagine synthase (glutamine-hydrolyzing) [Nitrospirae bacterium]|nr:asparagine synthase (glutamine-hydrolyzing) [Nitrospirota bacterium]
MDCADRLFALFHGGAQIMCGIAGYVSGGGKVADFHLEDAVRWLSHRGPDESGVWKDRGTGLGHSRLSIIDLNCGQQPMKSPDGRYVLIFNGEIYNFPELRRRLAASGATFRGHSDTEVMLHLLVADGFEKALAQLRGMFAFAFWDNHEQTLFLARDRVGVKPLVYAETPGVFMFASETGALFALCPELPATPDYSALDHYLTFQYIPSPLTGFFAVRKLPPAHAMIVKEGRIAKLWRYWDIDHTKRSTLSFDEACESLQEKFLEATRIRLVSDVPLGAFLSGGIDSSITVAAMTRLGSGPVKTFAIGFEDESFNELPYARRVAEHLGTDHHEMIVKGDAVSMLSDLVRHFGEPFADNSSIPTYYVSRFARQHVKVVLGGDGGDELFAGYKRFYQANLIDTLERHHLLSPWRSIRALTVLLENITRSKTKRVSFSSRRVDQALVLKGLERYKHLLSCFPDTGKEGLLSPEFKARISSSSLTSDYLAKHFARAQTADFINRYLYLDIATYLPENILFKVDICSMMNSLECRSPFLDHQLIEFIFSLPGHYKLKALKKHKHLLKEACKEWLPEGFMKRGKMGFSPPMLSWMRKDMAHVIRHRLIEKKILSPLIRDDVVGKYVEEHLSGHATHYKYLWSLLVLAEWVMQYKVPLH